MVLVLLMVWTTPGLAANHNGNGGSAHAFDNKIIKKIDEDRIYEHVSHLSEEIGPRGAGTEAELETVDYLVEQFENYGYEEVNVQEFTFLSGEKKSLLIMLKRLKSRRKTMTPANKLLLVHTTIQFLGGQAQMMMHQVLVSYLN